MGRWLALDTGGARVGLAVGSADGVGPLEVIPAEPAESVVERVRQLAAEYDVDGLVVGWPINMDGTVGPQAELACRIAQDIAAATGLDVRLWDERLSSFAADAALAGHMTRGKRKKRQDAIAAATFLSDFFAGDGPATASRPDEHIEGL